LSKYYELLQRVSVDGGGENLAFPPPAPPTSAPRTYEMRPVPDAHVLSREELVKLIQSLFLQPGKDSPKVIVFTGADSGVGCSSICAGAAEALAAHVTEPVCLVDSNLRYPSLHLCLGVDNTRGLSEALMNPDPIQEFVRKMPGGGLWLLSSGLNSSTSTGTMNASRLAERVGELRKEFPFVLMDSPPVNVYSDAISLGQSADGVLLVVSAHKTRKEAARRAKESLEIAGARLLGAVMNNRTYPIPQGIYDRL
jgi:Mrp family chromosome partitioning ATPase